MLKQVGSVVVAGLVGAMSYSAQGDSPNPMVPIVLAGGAFLGASFLFTKLEPDLSVPIVASPSSSSSSSSPSSTTHENGKKKGKKATKVVKKDEPKVGVVADVVDADASDDDVTPVVAAKKVDKKKKKASGAKKEEKVEKVAAPVVAAVEKKATKATETPKKATTAAAAAGKKDDKKAVVAPVVAKKDDKKKDGKKAAAAAPVAAKKDDKKDGKKKKAATPAAASGGKKEEKKSSVVSTSVVNDASDDEEAGWEVVRKARPVKKEDKEAKEASNKGSDGTDDKEVVKEKSIQITLKVNPSKFGVIIGAKGATLEKLQSKTGARITIPKKENDDQVLIAGTASQVENAKRALQDMAELGWSKATHSGWDTSEFKVNNEHDKGLIFGSGGTTIKKLQDHFHVVINVSSTEGDLSGNIGGEKEDVRAAKAAIKELLTLKYSPVVYPDFVTRAIPITRSAIKAVMGTKGGNIKHIKKTTKVHGIHTPERNDTSEQLYITLIGESAQVDAAERMVRTFLQPEEPAAPEEQWADATSNEDDLW